MGEKQVVISEHNWGHLEIENNVRDKAKITVRDHHITFRTFAFVLVTHPSIVSRFSSSLQFGQRLPGFVHKVLLVDIDWPNADDFDEALLGPCNVVGLLVRPEGKWMRKSLNPGFSKNSLGQVEHVVNRSPASGLLTLKRQKLL